MTTRKPGVRKGVTDKNDKYKRGELKAKKASATARGAKRTAGAAKATAGASKASAKSTKFADMALSTRANV